MVLSSARTLSPTAVSPRSHSSYLEVGTRVCRFPRAIFVAVTKHCGRESSEFGQVVCCCLQYTFRIRIFTSVHVPAALLNRWGILDGKLRMFNKAEGQQDRRAASVIQCCMLLHNACLSLGDEWPESANTVMVVSQAGLLYDSGDIAITSGRRFAFMNGRGGRRSLSVQEVRTAVMNYYLRRYRYDPASNLSFPLARPQVLPSDTA